jgi:hypothetical protein
MFYSNFNIQELKIRKLYFFSKVRKESFNFITRKSSGCQQWRYITGKQNRTKIGLITLNDRSKTYFQKMVDYYNSEDGNNDLKKLSIDTPESIDDIIDWIRNAYTTREMKNKLFKYAMNKIKEEILI